MCCDDAVPSVPVAGGGFRLLAVALLVVRLTIEGMNTYSEPDHLTGYCADARVAIVDNDERALESVVSLFADRLPQIDVIWSTTEGLRAIKSCKEHELKPDLLLLDMSSEGIQGPSVCRGIRRFDGRACYEWTS